MIIYVKTKLCTKCGTCLIVLNTCIEKKYRHVAVIVDVIREFVFLCKLEEIP